MMIMSPGHVPSNTVGADPYRIPEPSQNFHYYGGSSDITEGHRRVMGCERSWQGKSMFSADKPLGDMYAVIWVAFYNSFPSGHRFARADSASVPNCPLHFALGIACSSALLVWPLPPPQDRSLSSHHSVLFLHSGNCCETLERRILIFISMKIKTAWRPPFPSCSGQVELQPLLAVLGMPREC